ncbi:MAG: hypothetical protein FWG64_00855 [Firmicutes bacterium]|nr:hypothetical protein [Bacillota bacterium]
MTKLTVTSRNAAWDMVEEIFPTDYAKDELSRNNAGYPIYRSTSNPNNYICDLNCRLELNMGEYGEITRNIWVEPEVEIEEVSLVETFTNEFEQMAFSTLDNQWHRFDFRNMIRELLKELQNTLVLEDTKMGRSLVRDLETMEVPNIEIGQEIICVIDTLCTSYAEINGHPSYKSTIARLYDVFEIMERTEEASEEPTKYIASDWAKDLFPANFSEELVWVYEEIQAIMGGCFDNWQDQYIFQTNIRLLLLEESSILNESKTAHKIIEQLNDFEVPNCKIGQKIVDIVDALCKSCGVDKHSDYKNMLAVLGETL